MDYPELAIAWHNEMRKDPQYRRWIDGFTGTCDVGGNCEPWEVCPGTVSGFAIGYVKAETFSELTRPWDYNWKLGINSICY